MSAVTESIIEHESVVFKIRDFLRHNRAHDVQAWFDSEMLPNYSSEVRNIINDSSLIMLSKNDDFQQLLFESSVKLIETKRTLSKLIDDNTRLMSKIKIYLNDNDQIL